MIISDTFAQSNPKDEILPTTVFLYCYTHHAYSKCRTRFVFLIFIGICFIYWAILRKVFKVFTHLKYMQLRLVYLKHCTIYFRNYHNNVYNIYFEAFSDCKLFVPLILLVYLILVYYPWKGIKKPHLTWSSLR